MVKMYRKFTYKGTAIRFQMDRGLTNRQISKTLGVSESLVRYYRRRPEKLEVKRASKFPKKFIDEIYRLGSNKGSRKISARLITIRINKKLKKEGVLDKKGRPLTISKRQVYTIINKK